MTTSHQAHEHDLERSAGVVIPFEPSPARRRHGAAARRASRPPRQGNRQLLLAPPPRGPLWQTAEELLGRAGVHLGGRRPWDLQVSSPHLYARYLAGGAAGLARAFVAGWWDSARPDETLYRVAVSGRRAPLPYRLAAIAADLLVDGDRTLVREGGEPRPDLWHRVLDRRMAQGCALWHGSRDLDGAQEARLEGICRDLDLRPGMRLLDLSCGWGATARFAAGLRGAQALGLTPWEAQAEAARGLCRGVPVEVRCQGWRDLVSERFDRAVAVGGIHPSPGWSRRAFYRAIRLRLEDDGILLVQGLGCEPGRPGLDLSGLWPEGSSRARLARRPFPTARQMCRSFDGPFALRSWRDLSTDYERTLLTWANNLVQAWPEVSARHGDAYCRLWRIAFAAHAAACRAGGLRLWELVLSAR